MKFSITLFLSFYLLTAYTLFGQTPNTRNKFDSSFTLAKHIHQDKLNIGQHGVFFNEDPKQVVKDFDRIEALSLINLKNYQRQVTSESNHLIKIWTSENVTEKILKIVEINSKYLIDTTEENGQKFKGTVIYNNYFIQFRDTTRNVQYETIDKQGVNNYSMGNRQVFAQREMILTDLLHVDNSKEIERLLNKYKNAQQQVWQ